MSRGEWLLLGGLAVFAVVATVGLVWVVRRLQARRLARARREFHQQREHLEAKYWRLAAASGKPRGLAWVDCDFADDVVYARDKRSGGLTALVGVTIRFEAIEGGGMEEVEAVSNLRAATAVFHLDQGRWTTQGRAIFNLNPAETIQYYGNNLELVSEENFSRP
jgi:hypothetical protein